MLKIQVHFMSILGELMELDNPNPTLELPNGSTFKDLMKEIRDQYEKKFPDKMYENGEFKMIHLMLNRRDIYENKDGDHPLRDGDELYFIPPIGGG